jgi:cell division protein FtsB
MKWLDRVPSFLRNKYLLVVAGLGIWLLLFDRNDVFTQLERRKQVKKLEEERAYYHTEIERNKKEIQELRSDPKQLEKFAREHYLMKRDNEEVFVIVEDTIASVQK